MIERLKTYLAAERGRQRRVAEEVGITESYLSNIARGKKPGSLDVMKRIASVTGLPLSELVEDSPVGGFREDAAEYTPHGYAPTDLANILAPKVRNKTTLRATVSAPFLAILEGDILIVDMRNPARSGDIVLGAVAEGNTVSTRILRYLPPVLVSGDPNEPAFLEENVRVQGPIVAVARGKGL